MHDSAGVSLIRLSTESQADYSRWLEALEAAGCVRVGRTCFIFPFLGQVAVCAVL